MKTNYSDLLNHSTEPYESIAFQRIRPEHFLPALDEAIQMARSNIESIKNSTAPAGFESTIVSYEAATEPVDQVSGIYFNLHSAEATPEIQKIAQEFSPRLSSFYTDISLDEKLFHKIKEVFDQRNSLNLTTEQTELLNKTYKGFVRNGALLPEEKKQRLKAINDEMARLGPKFSENVLKATNHFELWIKDEADLAGLPPSALEAAKYAAKEKGHGDQWLFTLQAPSYIPFMTYSARRELREKMWKAFAGRSLTGEFSNKDYVLQLVKLRAERAELMGYQNHAKFVLEERMAETPEKVMSFLQRLLEVSKPAAQRDVEHIRLYKEKLGDGSDLLPWDYAYYSEKLKQEQYDVDQEKLRPYFELDRVLKGAFELAHRLYGLNFKKIDNVPVYHPDVSVFEVTQATTKDHVGLFYTDFFPRGTKRGGAWATSYREQGMYSGMVKRPHVSIVCNFTPPTESEPSLLTFDEVTTLFHEFGHALHMLLSNVKHRSISGTNVYWDFVELPSQIMENWASEYEALSLFAHHYKTGEILPKDVADRLKSSAQFQAGYRSLRQVEFSLLDMYWHTTPPSQIQDIEAFERDVTEVTRVLPLIEGTNKSVSFSHIFDGGYSAGYYSYKWAEVLDADAFEAFKEHGIFNEKIAKQFKENILERGGTEHPMELYKKFRGREPDPDALLKRQGLLK